MNLEDLRSVLEATMESADPAVTPRDRAKALQQYVALFGDELRQQATARETDYIDTLAEDELRDELDHMLVALVAVAQAEQEREEPASYPGLARAVRQWADALVAGERREREAAGSRRQHPVVTEAVEEPADEPQPPAEAPLQPGGSRE